MYVPVASPIKSFKYIVYVDLEEGWWVDNISRCKMFGIWYFKEYGWLSVVVEGQGIGRDEEYHGFGLWNTPWPMG